MSERLRRALAHIDELPPEVQEELATLIEERTEPEPGPAADGGAEAGAAGESAERSARTRTSLAGAWSDLLYDDEFAAFERMRHEVPPSPPIDLEDL